ncbi:MAG: hypothetical protein INR69_18265 [Mucilaginibacter polytrichastri]|nr:hypothetical protein [Mucilaginibacter polytrichastri]
MKRPAIIAILFLAGFAWLGFGFSKTSISATTLLNRLVMINPASATRDQKIEITPDGFFRLRKKYVNGKQEYFSFHFSRFADLDYYGNEAQGNAQIIVADTNIIVQTFQDPKGNVDSMASTLRLDLKSPTAEDLSALSMLFKQLHTENLSAKRATDR